MATHCLDPAENLIKRTSLAGGCSQQQQKNNNPIRTNYLPTTHTSEMIDGPYQLLSYHVYCHFTQASLSDPTFLSKLSLLPPVCFLFTYRNLGSIKYTRPKMHLDFVICELKSISRQKLSV